MTTNKPEVKRYKLEYGHDSMMRKINRMQESEGGVYVRFDDYEALQVECEKLRCIISDLKDWDCDVSAGFLSIPVHLRRRMQEAIDAAMAQGDVQ